MRGPSFWTAGEREYLAMSVARLLQCPFCIETHAELTRIAADGEIDAADASSARPEVTAALRLREKVTLAPAAVTGADVDEVRATGAPDEAIVDAPHVNLIWNVVNRLALAFDFELRDGQLVAGTRSLHRFGYRFPGFLMSERLDVTDATVPGDGRHVRLVAGLRTAVFDSVAQPDAATRAAAGVGGSLPQPRGSYAAKVRDHAYRVTDGDIERLKAAGLSEDEIFEITVAAAVGAALHRLDAGLAAVRNGEFQAGA